MADPFSIAASALAVASAGAKLAKILYGVVESARKSEEYLKPVADQVKLTADILVNVNLLLNEADVRALCRATLLSTIHDALVGCEKAFSNVSAFIEGLTKTDDRGAQKLKTFTRLTLIPLRSRELNLLLVNLDRFKSSLELVLAVLNTSLSIKLV